MGVPKQVEEAGKKAEALQKELNEGTAPGQQPPADPGQQPVNPQQPADPQGQQPKQDVHQQTPPNAQPQSDQQQQGQEPPPQEDYRQKYASLQGMYNSTVPKLQAEVERLRESENALQSEIQQLKEAANQNNQPDPNGAGEIPKLNKEDFAEYDEEFGKLVEVVNQLRTENESLKGKLSNLSNNVTESQKNSEAIVHKNYLDAVIGGIANLGGNFDVLNTDHNFLNWLRQVPTGDFEPRFAKLKRAEQARDLTATMAIWSEYLTQHPASQQEPPINPNPQAQQQSTDVNQQIQQQQQPGQQPPPNLQPEPTYTGTDLAPPAQQMARTWSRAQIRQFYSDVTAGKFRGKDQEKAALEADIMAAQQEGRFVG